MQNRKFCGMLLASVIIVGILGMSPVLYSLMSRVVISSHGQLSGTVTALSGYWIDIQDAVDWIAADGGVGNVLIPEGTFNFVNVGESWTGYRVTIPAGINLFGAPTERYANGSVVEWKTVLVMPWDVPGSGTTQQPVWFRLLGNGDPDKPSRFSNIKLVGYRSIDPDSETTHRAMRIDNVVDFRVDHCHFEHTTFGIWISGATCNGVFDHSYFTNPAGGDIGAPDYYSLNIGYGLMPSTGGAWDSAITKILGQYTSYSVYVEDCYFEKWRHITAAGDGAHQVIRNCIIKDDYGYGSIDAHPGTRATEVYNCQIIDAIQYYTPLSIRGGAGIAFNNTVGGGTFDWCLIHLRSESGDYTLRSTDWWVWDNNLIGIPTEVIATSGPVHTPVLNTDYFLRAPSLADDGWDYEPYPYPHPLTLETTP